jgi:hypothetical protein
MSAARNDLTQGVWSKLLLLSVTLPLLSGSAFAQNAAPIAYRHAHRYIVIPLTRHYAYRPYWWPQGQYHWSLFGVPERWGFWCDGAGSRHISC